MARNGIPIQFYVSSHERDMILQKAAQCGCHNLSAYLRKMAIDGYIIHLDLPELKEISSLLRCAGNNINQIARRANQTRQVYDTDLQEIIRLQGTLLERFAQVLNTLSRLK